MLPLLLLPLLLTGCVFYSQPLTTQPVPVAVAHYTEELPGQVVGDAAWYESFADPQLQQLLQQALRDSLAAGEIRERLRQAGQALDQAGVAFEAVVPGHG